MEIILLFTPKNARFQNLQLIFLVILQISDLECHGQTSVNVDLLMFGVVFMKFKKPLPRKQTNMDLRYFHCLSDSLFYGPLQFSKSSF